MFECSRPKDSSGDSDEKKVLVMEDRFVMFDRR